MKTQRDLENLQKKIKYDTKKRSNKLIYNCIGVVITILIISCVLLIIRSRVTKQTENLLQNEKNTSDGSALRKEETFLNNESNAAIKWSFLSEKYDGIEEIYAKANNLESNHNYEEAKFLFYSIEEYEDSEEKFETMDGKRDQYMRKEAEDRLIPPSQLNDEIATDVVQTVIDILTKSVEVIIDARETLENGNVLSIEIFIYTLINNMQELDEAIILLNTLGENVSISEIKSNGIEICEEWRDKWWEIVYSIENYESINQAQWETLLLRQDVEGSLYKLQEWGTTVSKDE